MELIHNIALKILGAIGVPLMMVIHSFQEVARIDFYHFHPFPSLG
jgi:hypothetical protein